jgi:hypothetical protein
MAGKPSDSIQAFTNNLIDYEGLFPPTELSLSEALGNFLRYHSGDYNWMLSSFVCPSELLPELGNLVKKKYDGEDKIKVTVLGRGGNTEKEFVSGLTDDVEIWKGFSKTNAEKVITNTFNVKLPSEVVISHDTKVLSSLVYLINELISDNIPGSVRIYLEGDLSNKWKKNVKAV